MSQKTNSCMRSWTRGFLFSLLVSSSVVSGYEQHCIDIEGTLHSYDDNTHMCCNNTVINHQQGRFKCYPLGNYSERWFDSQKEEVCNGIFYSAEHKEIKCSTSGPYNYTTSIDCGGVIHSRENGDACCGTRIRNSSSEVCCTDSSTGMIVSVTPEECCNTNNTLEGRNIPCCAGALFDPEEKMCCHENLYNKTGVHRCSGDPNFPIYDVRTHFEVRASVDKDPVVVEIVDGKTSLCGEEPYNPNNSFCDERSWKLTLVRTDSKSGSTCNSVPYNKENATCCHGNITEGVPEIEGLVRCVGSSPVFQSDHLICWETVYPRSESIDEACCASEVYRTDTQICCAGKIHNKSSPSTDCCGDSTFDRTTQLCYSGYYPYINIIINGTTDQSKACAGKLLGKYEICKRTIFNEEVVAFREDVDALCGAFGYKKDEYFCDRDGFLVPRGPYEELCVLPLEDRLFDTRKYICCGGDILPRFTECGKERACCNEAAFVPEYETCSHATGIWKVPTCYAGRCGISIFDNRTEVCDSKYNLVVEKDEYDRKPSVCFDEDGLPIRFNQWDHFCCNGQLWNKTEFEDPDCCYDVPFDKASPNHICCEGSLLSTGGVPMTCEGSVAYSEEQQVCGGVVYNKSDGSCCGSGVYDNQTEICCEDEVKIAKFSETERCCGLSKFDEADATLVCCGNSTLHENIPGFQCCASSLMNPEESICLNDEYIISRQLEDKTCNSSILEHDRGTCCAGILHVGKFGSCDGLRFVGRADDQLWCGQGLLKHGEACCDGIPYDVESYACVNNSWIVPICNGVTFDKSSQSCCNQEIINNAEKICCSGRTRNVNDGENGCCQEVAYNSETHICCRNRVKALTDPTIDLEKCCDRNERFNLTSGRCQQVPPTGSGCPVCPEYRRSKEEIETAARDSSHQAMIRVTHISSSNSREVSVRVPDLPKDCQNCHQNLHDQRIDGLVLPEGCSCRFVLNSKYVLLENSPEVVDGKLMLSDKAVLLPRKHLNRVIRSIDGKTS